MKNLHVLPTENESRIRYNSYNKVCELCKFPKYHTDIKSTRNIYITSDEEIKEGDWYILHLEDRIAKRHKQLDLRGITPEFSKKIILTTDQYLIKDGVQPIDDEFLEWFVNNPSCEDVEIKHIIKEYVNDLDPFGYDVNKYKIIIPKEGAFKHELRALSKEEVLANRCSAYEFIDFDKQETLEKAAKKEYNDNLFDYEKYRDGFIIGAKWQAERMYSEDEVINFLIKINSWPTTFDGKDDVKEWFDQFKKK